MTGPTSNSGQRSPELRHLRRVSHLLDSSIRVPGTDRRVGIDPLIGLVPVVGDYVGLALSLYVVVRASGYGLPRKTLVRMLFNVGLEAVVGSVPLLGDLFDFVWKANERNVALLERHVESPREAERSDTRFLLGVALSVVVAALVLVVLLALAVAAVIYGLTRLLGSPV